MAEMFTTAEQIAIAAVCFAVALALGVLTMGWLLIRRHQEPQRHWRPRAEIPEPAPVQPAPRLDEEPGLRLPFPRAWWRGTQCELHAAGINVRRQQDFFLAWQLMLAVICASAGVHMGLARPDPAAVGYALVYACLGMVAGFNLPRVWLSSRRRERLAAIQAALPDAIDLLVVCVEAGMGLNAALLRVTEEVTEIAPELSEEFTCLNQEMRAGASRSQALRSLSERLPLPDLESLTGVLIQAERMGGSISVPLRTQAQLLRTRRRQRAEEGARKATVKLIFPLVLFVFPVILIVMLGPALYDLMQAFSSMAGGGG